MKKIITLFVLVCLASLANGQIYIGGSIGWATERSSTRYAVYHDQGVFSNVDLKVFSGRLAYGFGIEQIFHSYSDKHEFTHLEHSRYSRLITVPIKFNVDYHFYNSKKTSPYLGLSTGVSRIKTNTTVYINGDKFIEESYSSGSLYAGFRTGILINTKFSKIAFNANYNYIPNADFSFTERKSYNSHIFNLGMGMYFRLKEK